MKNIFYILSFILLTVFSARAQNFCNASFTMQVTGTIVAFSDQSSADSNSTILSWSWNYGDGNSSSFQSPTHNYSGPGTYNVCLVIMTTAQCVDSICRTIVIQQGGGNCNAAYSYSSSGLNVAFTDASTNATSWAWDFGDGNTSIVQNPNHTYSAPGNYSVSLNIIDTNSACQDTVVHMVNLLNQSTCYAYFTYRVDTNGNVNFFDSSGSQIDTWFWDFGDGTTSNTQSPQHTYSGNGPYTACLTVSDSNDSTCWDQYCVTFSLNGGSQCFANFASTSNGLTTSFTDQSSGNMNWWYWSFGDGNYSSAQNPTHTYSSAGLFYVVLTAGDSLTQCSDSVVHTVNLSNSSTCRAMFNYSNVGNTFSFNDNSTGNTTNMWIWSFGDGTFASTQNATHTYSQPGTYIACLSISSTIDSTCYDTYCDTIVIHGGSCQANFSWIDSNGHIYFTDLSTSNPTGWNWDFGDGNSSTNQNPIHSYQHAGPYNVCLVMTDSNSCTSTFCDSIIASTSSSIKNNIDNNSIRIYPSPATNKLFFESEVQNSLLEYEIFDLLGSVKLRGTLVSSNESIGIGLLTEGLYIIRLENDNGVAVTKRFVKSSLSD